jgi:hypothetical protein
MLCGKWLQSLSPIWCEWLTCWAFDAQNRNFIPWSEEFRVPRTPVIAIVAADAVTHPAEQESAERADEKAGGEQRDGAQKRRHRMTLLEELDRQDRGQRSHTTR